MTEKIPLSDADLRDSAAKWGFELPADEDRDEWRMTAAAWSEALHSLTDLEEEISDDREYWVPTPAEDPNAACFTRTDIVDHQNGELAGTRITIKDNISVAGVRMTCGSQAVTNYQPPTDATVVERILAAGARIVGKTTMSEFAIGGSRETMRFRLPRHPSNPDRYPGGSSSGSAIAVAEGSADAALGSDTAASIRCPAAFCGVVGIKPTSELVSQHGFVGFAPPLDALGVLSRTVKGGAAVLESIAGEDPVDPRTVDREAGEYTHAADCGAKHPPTDITVGIPDSLGADAGVSDVVEEALNEFADAGATLKRVTIPDIEYALPAWLALASAEFRAYIQSGGQGPREPVETAFEENINRLNDTLHEFLVCADGLQRHGNHRYETLARHARSRVRSGVEHALDGVDVFATPTMPTVAPLWDDRDSTTQEGTFLSAVANTAPFNVADQPAISLPCGTVEKLPVGVQFVGDRFGEEQVLHVAGAFERQVTEFDW